jgi:hypothetical protein
MTWRSPDGQTFNQIDHLLIDARHVSNVMDVRTFRGANIDSDHYLLISEIRSWISSARKMYGSYYTKFNSETLKSPETSSAYREKLNGQLARRVDMMILTGGGWFLKMQSCRQLAQY